MNELNELPHRIIKIGRVIPTRETRSPVEQAADAQAMQQYFRDGEKERSIRYLYEKRGWRPVVPGDNDYERALPNKYDQNTGMPISPWDSNYEGAVKKRPKQFR